MSTTIAVALITTLSTLAGVAITGSISLLVTRAQLKGQLILAEKSSLEQHASNKRQICRDVYAGFLNQASLIERKLQLYWYENSPAGERPAVALTDEMNELAAKYTLVALEGPTKVSQAALEFWRQLDREIGTIEEIFREPDGANSASEDNSALYRHTLRLRQEAKGEVIEAAQRALGDIVLPSKHA